MSIDWPIRQRASILGFSIIDSGPIRAVHLPYRDGLTVLYGQNGAGKTTALRGIGAAMRGFRLEEGRAFAHLRIDDDYYLDNEGESESTLGTQIGVALSESLAPLLSQSVHLDPERIDELSDSVLSPLSFRTLTTALVHLLMKQPAEEMVSSPVASATSIGACRTVTLEAVGASTPEWTVFVSACVDESRFLSHARSVLATLAPRLGAFKTLNDSQFVRALLYGMTDPPNREADDIRPHIDLVAAAREHFSEDFHRDAREAQDLLLEFLQDEIARRKLDPESDESIYSDAAQEGMEEAIRGLRFDELVSKLRWEALPILASAAIAELGELGVAIASDAESLNMYSAFDPAHTPAWTPMPLFATTTTALHLNLPKVAADSTPDVIERITDMIHRDPDIERALEAKQENLDERQLGRVDAEEITFTLSKEIEKVVRPLVQDANSFLEAVLPDAPLLRASDTSLIETFRGTWLRWEAFDTPSLRWVGVGEMSSAQQRWIDLALLYAVTKQTPDSMLLIDEPERALHRGAIARMARQLPGLAAHDEAAIVIASHAPEFIALDDTAVFHITRAVADGSARAEELTSVTQSDIGDAAELLGITPADLLQMTRTFVLVEGSHDQIVIEALIGDVLGACDARIIPIRGTKALASLLDTEVLLPFTTARLLVVLDHITKPELLESEWLSAREVARTDVSRAVSDFAKAVSSIQRKSHPTAEDQDATSLAFSLLRSDYAQRVDLFGLTRVGIEKYLPIESFTEDGDITWESLDDQYMAQAISKRKSESEKQWLRRVHGINVDSATLRSAVARIDGDQMPDEILRLAEAVRQSGRPSE